MVSQERPAWKPSRLSFSNMRWSLVTGKPHSLSWYLTYRGWLPAHQQRATPSSPVSTDWSSMNEDATAVPFRADPTQGREIRHVPRVLAAAVSLCRGGWYRSAL